MDYPLDDSAGMKKNRGDSASLCSSLAGSASVDPPSPRCCLSLSSKIVTKKSPMPSS